MATRQRKIFIDRPRTKYGLKKQRQKRSRVHIKLQRTFVGDFDPLLMAEQEKQRMIAYSRNIKATLKRKMGSKWLRSRMESTFDSIDLHVWLTNVECVDLSWWKLAVQEYINDGLWEGAHDCNHDIGARLQVTVRAFDGCVMPGWKPPPLLPDTFPHCESDIESD